MATAPNYYYNSPWIADAGRNLAAALKPPDPQELLQRERAKWMYDREQMMAGRADEKYMDQQAVEDAFAAMVKPVYNPETGEIDQVATNKQVLENLSVALQRGGDASAGLKLAGVNSPEFAVKEAVAEMQANKLLQGIRARGDEAENLAGYNWDRKDLSREDTQDFTAQQNEKKWAHESEQNYLKQQARLRQIAAAAAAKKASGGGGEWHSPPDNILKEMSFALDDMIRATGRTMSLQQRDQFMDRAITRWQKSGNPRNAVNQQWAKSFPKATSYDDVEHAPDTPGGWFSSGTRGGLSPIFVDDPEEEFGDVLTDPSLSPEPIAAPPTAAPPSAAPPKPAGRTPPRAGKNTRTPPDGARSKDKNGKPIIYSAKNKRWEYPD